MPEIEFHSLIGRMPLRDREKLRFFLVETARKAGFGVDHINFVFCDDAYLLELNQAHLGHDTYTDIITFQLNDKGQPLLADVYISLPRVRENADLHKTTMKEELHRVIFHGMLHLLGNRDKTPKDRELMRLKEAECLAKYFT